MVSNIMEQKEQEMVQAKDWLRREAAQIESVKKAGTWRLVVISFRWDLWRIAALFVGPSFFQSSREKLKEMEICTEIEKGEMKKNLLTRADLSLVLDNPGGSAWREKSSQSWQVLLLTWTPTTTLTFCTMMEVTLTTHGCSSCGWGSLYIKALTTWTTDICSTCTGSRNCRSLLYIVSALGLLSFQPYCPSHGSWYSLLRALYLEPLKVKVSKQMFQGSISGTYCSLFMSVYPAIALINLSLKV